MGVGGRGRGGHRGARTAPARSPPPAVPIGAGLRRGVHVPRQRGARARPGRSAAGWCPAPRSCWPASPVSARARCCSRWRRRRRATGERTLYVTGEESAAQVRLRADRTGGVHDELYLAAETDLGAVLSHIEQVRPKLLVVDSVQTIGGRGDRRRARRRHPGQGGRRRPDPGGQDPQHHHGADRPRHQGRLDRRAAGARAPRRRGAALRGRAATPGSGCCGR